MLVHMAPQEVAGLQALAMKHGGTLTINPDTGLPEAGFLSKILPMLAGAALNYFAPGFGTAISGALGLGEVAGAAAIGTGIGVGGATALATGSLSRGLMAGLGAYGGAGLTEGLMAAGSTEAGLSSGALNAELAQGAQAGVSPGESFNRFLTGDANPAVNETLKNATPYDKLAAGAKSAAGNPLAFAKENWMPTAAAALPVLSAIGTTTPMTAKPVDTGYVRQKLYDPYTQTYKTLAPVKANEWGNRSFSDAYTNPQTGEMSTLQPRAPGMAEGGIVALAIGGDTKAALEAAYAANDVGKINEIAQANMVTAADVADTYKGFDTSGIKGLQLYTPPNMENSINSMIADQKAGGDGTGNLGSVPTGGAGISTPAYNQYTDQQIGDYLRTNQNVDIGKAIKDTNADPAAVNRYIASLANPFVGSTETTGGSGTLGIYNNMIAQGIDPNEAYAALVANDPKYAGWNKEMIQKGYNLDKGAYALSAAQKGVVADKDWVKFMDANNYSINDAAQAFGLSLKEVRDRYNAVKNAEKKTTVTGTGGTGGINTGNVTGITLPTNPQTNAPPGTTNPYGNKNNPGDLTFNADGTVTVQPNIPGRPYGGFSGMDEVKNAYTTGGGSLGYTPKAPKTIAEFEQMYNQQTGDSMAAYNYLMGKAGASYPIQSTAASTATGIMRPYFSAGMKYKPKFLTKNADGTISSSTTSGTAPLTAAKTINVSNPQGLVEVATLGSDGAYHAPSGGSYDVTGKALNVNTNDNQGGTGGEAAGGLQQSYARGGVSHPFFSKTTGKFTSPTPQVYADGGYALGGLGTLGGYSDGGRLLKGPGDGVSDSIPATIGAKQQPARLADGEFVVPARIVSELGNGSTEAGAKKLYAMMDRVQKARGKTTGKNKVAANSRADKYLPA
jgi:hypothetical protein